MIADKISTSDMLAIGPSQKRRNPRSVRATTRSTETLADIEKVALKEQILVNHPQDEQLLAELKATTPARIGMGRAGTRYKTVSQLRFLADHAAAKDAVLSEVPDSFIERLHLLPIQTACDTKTDYLKNPDKGRVFPEKLLTTLLTKLPQKPTVQLVVGDGLSSAAVLANVAQLLPLLKADFKKVGIEVDLTTIPFVKYSRVAAMDQIAQGNGAKVTCILIGERPGLVTSQSLSVYMAYEATKGMAEARRHVISNIYSGGTTVEQAAKQVVELSLEMLKYRCSGVALRTILNDEKTADVAI